MSSKRKDGTYKASAATKIAKQHLTSYTKVKSTDQDRNGKRISFQIRQWLSRWFRLEKTSSPAEQIYFGFSDEEARAVVWLLSGSSFLNNVSALSCGCYSPRISMSGWVGCSLGGRLRAVLG
ncbi:unnamed protein product [Brassica oleracea var. botrytis]|uniref:(rape) hypothetical protein n=1 Tax=Brassica napus TaxID=3708 RepID=A0A816KGQ3_BRANA|nr:unnamed protein product [Brassica napus]